MQEFRNGKYEGERALFMTEDAAVYDSVFSNGESPLKESKNLNIYNCSFGWKYPLWYCNNVRVYDGVLNETARAGIWYTNDLFMKGSKIDAPKTFRRCHNINLENISMSKADETLWHCDKVIGKNLTAKGDYFGMNSKNVEIEGLNLDGNYPFDGGENIVIRNSKLMSKDAFWNCRDVSIYDSYISGEYLGWNSENLTFVNCRIESLQGLCYIKNLKMVNCVLENTTLCFEYSSVDAEINSNIESVKNPYSGKIKAKSISRLIMEPDRIDPLKTIIEVEDSEI